MEDLNLLDYIVPGMSVYSVIHQCNKFVLSIDVDNEMPILVGTKKYATSNRHKMYRFNKLGSILKHGTDCLIFPNKDVKSWVGFEPPVLIKKGEVVKAYAPNGEQLIAIYSHYDKVKQKHYCYHSVTEQFDIITREYDKVEQFNKNFGWLHSKIAVSKSVYGIYKSKNI